MSRVLEPAQFHLHTAGVTGSSPVPPTNNQFVRGNPAGSTEKRHAPNKARPTSPDRYYAMP